MSPLGLVVTGFALIVLDFRFEGVDLAADLAGWLAAAVGLWNLRRRDTWFTVATATAAIGTVVGVPDLLQAPQGLLALLVGVLETAFVFSVCSGVAAALRTVDGRAAARANLIRWVDLGLAVLLLLAVTQAPHPAVVLALGLATLAVAAWFMIFLLSVRGHARLQPLGRSVGAAPR